MRAEFIGNNRVKIFFTVRDNGSGIDAEDQKRIFSPFFQAQRNDVEISYRAGIGLGLSISLEIVKLMGGDIYFESQPGRGSEFLFWIECDMLCDGALHDDVKIHSNNVFSGLQALMVATNDECINLLVDKINSAGFTTCQVSTFDEAMSALVTEYDEYNVVFIDLKWSSEQVLPFVAQVRKLNSSICLS